MRPIIITSALSMGLLLAQAGSMTFPALMPTIMTEWELGEVAAGWLVGMYFAGYAVAVPVLVPLTDRFDARPVFVCSGLLAGLSVFVFPFCEASPALALLMRFLTGVGVAGVHMPGLGLLAARLSGRARTRGSSTYAACYALGTAGSFLLVGIIAPLLGWHAAFYVSGGLSLLMIPLVFLIGPASQGDAKNTAERTALFDVRPVLKNRAALAFVVAYAGNTWEVFGVRAWMVVFISFSIAQTGSDGAHFNPAVVSAVSALLGVVAGLIIAEIAVRRNRGMVIATTAIASILVALTIAASVDAPTWIIVALLLVHGATSYGDAPAISAGVVNAATSSHRGATLAIFALAGFLPGLVAPLCIGILIGATGGTDSPKAWRYVFVLLALGSIVATTAMLLSRRSVSRDRDEV